MPNKLIKITFVAATLALTSGCVIFKGNNLEKIDAKEVVMKSQEKKKIYVRWDFDFIPVGHSVITYEDREKLFQRVLDESNCCIIVKKKSEADIIFEGKAYDQRNPATIVGFFISVATVYMIPSWNTAKIFVSADVKKGKEIKSYEVKDSMTTAIWLPFVVATPFAYDFDKTHKEILENAYRSLILKMKNDSILN